MIVYRLASKIYIRDLSGTGALLYGGRWNRKGLAMCYTSGTLSLAALEIIANLSSGQLKKTLFCAEIEIPDELGVITIDNLPENWSSFPYHASTVELGSNFVKEEKAVVLKVPSAIIPSEFNYLLNPNHPDFGKIKIKDIRPMILDSRLIP